MGACLIKYVSDIFQLETPGGIFIGAFYIKNKDNVYIWELLL